MLPTVNLKIDLRLNFQSLAEHLHITQIQKVRILKFPAMILAYRLLDTADVAFQRVINECDSIRLICRARFLGCER